MTPAAIRLTLTAIVIAAVALGTGMTAALMLGLGGVSSILAAAAATAIGIGGKHRNRGREGGNTGEKHEFAHDEAPIPAWTTAGERGPFLDLLFVSAHNGRDQPPRTEAGMNEPRFLCWLRNELGAYGFRAA